MRSNVTRFFARALLVCVAAHLLQSHLPAAEPPTEWIDPDTGHRVLRLTREPGTASLYFNQNAYTGEGDKVVITTPEGLATIDLHTFEVQPVVEGRVRVIVVGRKTRQVYYMKSGSVYATHLDTKATREIAKLPFRASVVTVNADETLLAGTSTEFNRDGNAGGRGRAGAGAANSGSSTNRAVAREGSLERRYNMHLPMSMFTLDTETGEMKTIHHSTEWLNHLQFSPTDPHLLLFCHEGPWQRVDRIWTIRTDGTGLTKVHNRTMAMEIFGHEFWSADGKTVWYDLQTPRGEDFWVAGYNVENGRRTWYHLLRNEWSVHFNVSRDGKLFAGDGGDEQMVAHAPDGKWIYLFRPELRDLDGVAEEQKDLIQPGMFRAERLVNMSRHNYRLEPNVSFTPDGKWLIFRSNRFGPTYVFAVEVQKAEPTAAAK